MVDGDEVYAYSQRLPQEVFGPYAQGDAVFAVNGALQFLGFPGFIEEAPEGDFFAI